MNKLPYKPSKLAVPCSLVGCIGLLGMIAFCVVWMCFEFSWPFRLLGRYEHYADSTVFRGGGFGLSQDGKELVYASPQTGHGDIYIADSNGARNCRITTDPNYEGNPAFSPEGHIVFEREQNKCGHIWIMKHDGSGQKQLTFGSTYDGDPLFTRDGKHIWFSRTPVGSNVTHQIFETDLNGSPPVLVECLEANDGDQPSFSSRTPLIYFTKAQGGIWVMNQDGSRAHGLTKTGYWPTVSRDGKFVAFLDGPKMEEVWIMRADGSHVMQVYSSPGWKQNLVFSPDGSHLFFCFAKGTGPICRIKTNGKGFRVIVPAILPTVRPANTSTIRRAG